MDCLNVFPAEDDATVRPYWLKDEKTVSHPFCVTL